MVGLHSLERFLNFINKNAYIQTAIMGNSFCKSAADACLLLIRNCLRVGTLQVISTVFIFLGKYFIALVVGERQRRLLLSWAKAGKDSKGGSKATRSEALGDPSHLRRSYPQAAA